jgi:hypothetical protein
LSVSFSLLNCHPFHSRAANTLGLPAALRDLVKQGELSLTKAQDLVMKNEVTHSTFFFVLSRS